MKLLLFYTLMGSWLFIVHLVSLAISWDEIDEKEAKLPTKCHVCKYATRELQEELQRSGKSRDVFYTGHIFQEEPKKIEYRKSELRLTEALENACQSMLEYKVHKDRSLALRYEKVESTTFKTLKGLKNRGVKVDLGFPDEMWDSPDAEVTRMKTRCEFLIEKYEDTIADWYYEHQDKNLTKFLCEDIALKSSELNCLNETSKVGKEDMDAENASEIIQNTKDEKEKKTGKERKQISDKTNQLMMKKEEERLRNLIDEQVKQQAGLKRSNNEDQGPYTDSKPDEEIKTGYRDRHLHHMNEFDKNFHVRRHQRHQRDQDDENPLFNPGEYHKEPLRARLRKTTDPQDLRTEIRRLVHEVLDQSDDFELHHAIIEKELAMGDLDEIEDLHELRNRVAMIESLIRDSKKKRRHHHDRHLDHRQDRRHHKHSIHSEL